jgi:hypothetical protein
MRWRPPQDESVNGWYRVFALVPHYCDDIDAYVWLEYVWRKYFGTLYGTVTEYRVDAPPTVVLKQRPPWEI